MEEETQEAAELYAEPYRCPATNKNEYCRHDIISAFNNGANWQAERMYSEEEMLQALNIGFTSTDETWEECVEFTKEQFKRG